MADDTVKNPDGTPFQGDVPEGATLFLYWETEKGELLTNVLTKEEPKVRLASPPE